MAKEYQRIELQLVVDGATVLHMENITRWGNQEDTPTVPEYTDQEAAERGLWR